MELNRIANIASPTAAMIPKQVTPAETAKSFSQFLSESIGEVNKAQIESSQLNAKFASGQVQDVHQVMIASQKSTLLLQTTLQVRNKVIESYQEIMRMQV